MKTKNLLLFLFTVAFMSLLSTNAFAQWGSTVKASGDSEFLKALQDPSVQYVVLSEGYYSNISRKILDGETCEKKKPEGVAPSNSLMLKSAQATPNTCLEGYLVVPNQCFIPGSPGNSIDLTALAYALSGTCPNPGAWSCFSATLDGVNILSPTSPTITPSQSDPYNASATNFVEGAKYIFRYTWVGGSYISTAEFNTWKNPVFTLTDQLNVCINALPTTLSVNVTPQYISIPAIAPAIYGTTVTTGYSWSSSDAGVTISNSTSATPTFSASAAGDYTVYLTVDENVDADGPESTDRKSVV